MNLRDLEYFVAVAELGHFHAAAHRCFVSQPTLSGQLRKLEEELGHTLFERTTRQVHLTSFGREALPLARSVLEAAHALQQKAKALQDPFTGSILLGGFPTLAPWLFPRLVGQWAELYPSMAFFLVEDKSPILQKRLLDGSIDMALLALPQQLAGIQEIPLFSESFCLAVPAQHPWASRSSIHAAELTGLELLLLEDGHCLRDQALDLCLLYGAREQGRFRASGLETLRQMVRLGTGLTLIPQLAIPQEKESGICYIPIESPQPERRIGLYFRESHPRKPLMEHLAQSIRESCGHTLPVQQIE